MTTKNYPKYLRALYVNTIHRCYNSNSKECGKLTVCLRWRLGEEYFIADIGERPAEGYRLVLKDGATEFSKSNCVWSNVRAPFKTKVVRKKNNKNIMVEINGVSKNMTSWARETGIKQSTISARMRYYNITAAEAILMGTERAPRTSKPRLHEGLVKQINFDAKLESALGRINDNLDKIDAGIETINQLAADIAA